MDYVKACACPCNGWTAPFPTADGDGVVTVPAPLCDQCQKRYEVDIAEVRATVVKDTTLVQFLNGNGALVEGSIKWTNTHISREEDPAPIMGGGDAAISYSLKGDPVQPVQPEQPRPHVEIMRPTDRTVRVGFDADALPPAGRYELVEEDDA